MNVRRMHATLPEKCLEAKQNPPLSLEHCTACPRPRLLMCRYAVPTEAVLVLLGPEWVFYTPCLPQQDGKGL